MEFTSLNLEMALLATQVQYLGAVFVPPLLLLYTMDFCGIKIKPLTHVPPLLFIPLLTLVLVFTYSLNGIYYENATFVSNSTVPHLEVTGSAFYIAYFIMSYLVMLASFITAFWQSRRQHSLLDKHCTIVLVASLMPLLGNFLTVFLKTSELDFTPLLLPVTGLILGCALIFGGLFQLAPLAREEIVENMSDAFILIDMSGRFLDANRAAKTLFSVLDTASPGEPMVRMEGIPWDGVLWKDMEFSVGYEPATKHYRASLDVVWHDKRALCKCITIHDYTPVRELLDEITHLAEHDALTNIMNRRTFYRDAEKKCAEIRRYGGNMFVMMMDIDYFKRVNDLYGHPAGDEVLRIVAQKLAARFRKTDLFARYGGEEFCAFLPSNSPAKVLMIAEECRKTIEQMPIPFEDKVIYVTISIRIAAYQPDLHPNLDALISCADAALYTAKESGRNKVKCRGLSIA